MKKHYEALFACFYFLNFKTMQEHHSNFRKEHITEAINKIIKLFETGNVPKAITIATFPPYDVPSRTWSLANRLIMLFSGTSDARGWFQWKKAGRYINTGAKAFYILAPRLLKKLREDQEEEEEYVLTGFFPVPVFPVESTCGELLNYQKIELPRLPLMEKAQEWGIDVQGIAFHDWFYGYYQPGETEKIRLEPIRKIYSICIAHFIRRTAEKVLA